MGRNGVRSSSGITMNKLKYSTSFEMQAVGGGEEYGRGSKLRVRGDSKTFDTVGNGRLRNLMPNM